MGSGVGSGFKDTNLPLRSPRSTIRFEATKALQFDAASAAVHVGLTAETASEAFFFAPRRPFTTTVRATAGAATRRPRAIGCAIWNRRPSLARQASHVERW